MKHDCPLWRKKAGEVYGEGRATDAEYLFIAIASHRRVKKAGIPSYYLAPSWTCKRELN